MSIVRIWAIALNGFREVIRDRILYVLAFFAIFQAGAMRFLPAISAGAHRKIFLDLGLASIALLSSVIAIFVGTGLINKEIEKHTVLVLIPKPISNSEMIVGKHLGLTAVLAVIVAVMTLALLAFLSLADVSYSLGPLLVSQLFLLIELALLVAVALTLGCFTSSTLATLLSFGVYIMGHLSKDILELGKISSNATVEQVTRILYLILPNLERFNLKNEIVYSILPSTSDLLINAAYGAAYTTFLLAIAILLFSKRQF